MSISYLIRRTHVKSTWQINRLERGAIPFDRHLTKTKGTSHLSGRESQATPAMIGHQSSRSITPPFDLGGHGGHGNLRGGEICVCKSEAIFQSTQSTHAATHAATHQVHHKIPSRPHTSPYSAFLLDPDSMSIFRTNPLYGLV